jgi:hypothetical protein
VDDPSQVVVYRRAKGRPPTAYAPLPTALQDQGTSTPTDDTLAVATEALDAFVAVERPATASAVPLRRFTAKLEAEAVQLSWETERSTAQAFRVERSRGSSWTRIGTVAVPTEERRYTFTDDDLPYAADSLSYRLRQVQSDGTGLRYSKTRTVARGVDQVDLRGPAPNPARQSVRVRYAVPERQRVTLRLFDVLGRRVRTVVNRPQQGRHERRIDLTGLPSGAYFLRLRAGDTIRTERLTLVR